MMGQARALSPDGSFDICHQLGIEFISRTRTHSQEEKNTIVFVLRTALSNG